MRGSKRLLNSALQSDLDTMLELGASIQSGLQETHDHKEAVNAFLEKRKKDLERWLRIVAGNGVLRNSAPFRAFFALDDVVSDLVGFSPQSAGSSGPRTAQQQRFGFFPSTTARARGPALATATPAALSARASAAADAFSPAASSAARQRHGTPMLLVNIQEHRLLSPQAAVVHTSRSSSNLLGAAQVAKQWGGGGRAGWPGGRRARSVPAGRPPCPTLRRRLLSPRAAQRTRR